MPASTKRTGKTNEDRPPNRNVKKARTEPEVIDLDGDEEDTVNVTAPEVVEINPQVNK